MTGSSRLKLYTNTISEFIKMTPEGPDSQPIFEEQPLKIEVVRSGDLASVWVHYQAKFGTKNDLMEWTGYDLFSLIRFNKKWYISSLTYYADE